MLLFAEIANWGMTMDAMNPRCWEGIRENTHDHTIAWEASQKTPQFFGNAFSPITFELRKLTCGIKVLPCKDLQDFNHRLPELSHKQNDP